MTLRHPRAGRPGLSLIEVLLAMAILLLSLVAIGQLVDMGADRGLEARFHVRGARLLQAKMAEVEAGVIPVDGGGSGTFEDDPDWSWTVEATPQSIPDLYQVTVHVSRDYRGRPFEVTMSQLLFDPALTGSAAQAQKPATTSTSSSTSTTGGTTP